MHIFKLLFFVIFFNFCESDQFESTLGPLRPDTSPEVQRFNVKKLIQRTIPERFAEFEVVIDPTTIINGRDVFKIVKTKDGKIELTGSSAVAAAWAFNHYLKYYCRILIDWDLTKINLPNPLPDANVTIIANDRFRYYLNLCAYGYSHVWWNWADWERHIDWMAMNGYNLVPAFHAQELIWERVYRKFGMTEEEIDDHFTGPAFLPWNRQGNIRKWGGPLSKQWHNRSLFLQKAMLNRLRDFGITPILSSFTGYLPTAFVRLFPNVTFDYAGSWSSFKGKYCCMSMVDPSQPLFKQVGNSFMREQILEFGTNHAYIGDVFNEVNPKSNSTDYIRFIIKSIYASMADVDIQAVWLFQSWPFLFSKRFWKKELVEAFVTAIPQGNLIVLDYYAEQLVQWKNFDSYYGQPFIWCVLHNFGGVMDMYGPAHKINSLAHKARNYQNSTMIGTGIASEGIYNNYILYDLVSELGWRKEPADLKIWFKNYTIRRYGEENIHAIRAWDVLRKTVYQLNHSGVVKIIYAICSRPGLLIPALFWYNMTTEIEAWDHMILASEQLGNNTKFRTDLVDVTKQSLQSLFELNYQKMRKLFFQKHLDNFTSVADTMKALLVDYDRILATNQDFLLGNWLESAKSAATTPLDRRLFELNARILVTIWGPRAEIADYSCRAWSGLVKDYYAARWTLFLDDAKDSLVKKTKFDRRKMGEKIFNTIEKPFIRSTQTYSTKVEGDTVEVAKELHARWRSKIENYDDSYFSSINKLKWAREEFEEKFITPLVNKIG